MISDEVLERRAVRIDKRVFGKTKIEADDGLPWDDNKYDLVLAVAPNAVDNYSFYNNIVYMANDLSYRIFSPHEDIQFGCCKLEEVVGFVVEEAIPKASLVLAHLGCYTPEVSEMIGSIDENKKKFVIFYPRETRLVGLEQLRRHPLLRGDLVYSDEDDAIDKLRNVIARIGIR